MAFDYDFIKDIYSAHEQKQTNKEIQDSYGFGSNVVNIYINSFKVISDHYKITIEKSTFDKLDLVKKLDEAMSFNNLLDKSHLSELQAEIVEKMNAISLLRSSVSSVEMKNERLVQRCSNYEKEMDSVPYWVYTLFSWLKKA